MIQGLFVNIRINDKDLDQLLEYLLQSTECGIDLALRNKYFNIRIFDKGFALNSSDASLCNRYPIIRREEYRFPLGR